jgi:signal transduction histidine kinase
MHPRPWFDLRWLLLRLLIAFGLAGLAGALLGRRFTSPLMQLAKGADAFQSKDFGYRIPVGGDDEFAAVATAMNEMARQVSDHITNLETDAERRKQFLADIAHELRSPVTTMRTMAGALRDGLAEGPERRERAISALVRTSERLLRLVQELMELAKLDSNELPLNVRQVDLSDLAESVIQSYDVDATSAGIVLHPLQSASQVKVLVDPDRIVQVLDNIVGNAVSYAGTGAEISVRLEDGDPVKVTVSDTGKGIRSKDLPYIFDSFFRADAARTPGDCHSGLGLSIAHKLVELHGGRLTVESEEGKGTTVTMLLPRARQ